MVYIRGAEDVGMGHGVNGFHEALSQLLSG